ncbi:MAG: hypothetical protein C4326_09985 [Ignavibacteria bacterium]
MITLAMTEQANDIFPRVLREKERELLEFVLPMEAPGYASYRRLLDEMVVLAEGRRGKGNLVLGRPGDRADLSSPLPPVIAYGVVETTRDVFTITVRACVGDQIDVEIVSAHGEEIPDRVEKKRRWTYSSWKPGMPSPASAAPVREVHILPTLTLVIAHHDRRVWLHDATTRMNHLIPITNFYNELMLHKAVRDPHIALDANRFFNEHRQYTDSDLRAAFIAYNRLKRRVEIAEEQEQPHPKGWRAVLRRFFKR